MTNETPTKYQHNSYLIYLKIKLKHLGAEGKINNEEQRKLKDAWRMEKWKAKAAARAAYAATYNAVREHKLLVVRPEARATNLAYGFLRGRSYAALEERFYEIPDWDRVARIVIEFGQNHESLRNLSKEQVIVLLREWRNNHVQYSNNGSVWRKPNVADPLSKPKMKPKVRYTQEQIDRLKEKAKNKRPTKLDAV